MHLLAELPTWEVIAATAAVAAGAWSYARGIAAWLKGRVIVQRRADWEVAGLVLSYLLRGKDAPGGSVPVFGATSTYYLKPLGRYGRVVYQDMRWSGTHKLWVGRKPLWFHPDKEDKQVGEEYPFVFSFIRGTLDWDALVIEAMEWEIALPKMTSAASRFRVQYHYGKTLGGEIAQQKRDSASKRPDYMAWNQTIGQRLLKWKPEDFGAPPMRSIDGLAVMPQLQHAIDRARIWRKSKRWYLDRRLAWRLGFHFWGAPGTGKTTLARELAAEFNFAVHVLDLASMSNEDLRDAWTEAVGDAPCMVVIEDVDRVFDGDKNISPGGGMMSSGGLTFDCLLNCVDGIERSDGIMLVVTSNHPERVDPALRRAGRLDEEVGFWPLNYECRLKVARQILSEEDAERVAMETGDVPASAFTEHCCRIALARLYGDAVEKEGPYR